jgi:hypothetical protein
MIESIHIRNFRGIQTGHLDRFRQFNLLVGPNNCGKSTLLEALYLAGTASRDATLVYTSGETSVTYEVTVPAPDLMGYHPLSQVWGKHNFAERQAGLGHWRDGGISVRVPDRDFPLNTFDLLREGDFAQVEEQVIGLVGIENTEPNRKQGVEGWVGEMMGPDVLPFADQRLLFLWHRKLTYNYKGSAAWLVAGDLPVAQRVLFFDAGMILEHLPVAFYQEILEIPRRWVDRIGRHFGAIYGISDPLVQFAPPGPESRWVQGHIIPRDGQPMPVDSYGDGARIAFKVLVPLVVLAELAREDEPGLFLWEEPELFQHPQSLGRLLKEVVDIVKAKPIQLLLSTQSLEVVAYFTEMLRKGQVDADEVMAFRLALEEGTLRSSWFDADNLIAWLSDGLDPRVWDPLIVPVQYRLREEAP